ncbi:MAG: ribonuclease Z [Prevotella sp.]|nr:ribonuclease Z [Prevotella sp.]
MLPFKIHILGCGSALPTLKHYASSQIVEIRNKLFMIDCGEGSQLQLRRSKISFSKLTAIFISHLHGDHCFGVIGMISTFGLLGRTAPLHIYAHEDFEKILHDEMEAFCNSLDFEVVFHKVDTTTSNVVYEDKTVTVTTIPLDHRIPCCGYLFHEKQTLPHIRPDMIKFYNIPTCYINNIKNGADWQLDDGTVIPNSHLTIPADAPRTYAYCSDTKYMPKLYELVEGVDLLYHESTYCSDNMERAESYYHSTAAQAATVARDAHVKRLIIGHYSSRYQDESVFLKEAREIFPETELTYEMDVFEI